MKRNKNLFIGLVGVWFCMLMFNSCTTTKAFGERGVDVIEINVTTTYGNLYVITVDGVATGGKAPPIIQVMGRGQGGTIVNPLYLKLTGNPFVFGITSYVREGNVDYIRNWELTLTNVSNLKAGDVLLLRYDPSTNVFTFTDSYGTVVQQGMATQK